MKGFDLFSEEPWRPLAHLGITHPFFNLDSHTIIYTWIILGLLLVCLLVVNWFLRRETSVAYLLGTSFVNYFAKLCNQTLGEFSFKHIAFVTTIFVFIFSCNLFAVIPELEEPTANINTTLALALVSFLYVQYYSIRAHGLGSYIGDYFKPFKIMLPLNLVGKVATIVSLAFRLFGNILGGVIITKIVIMVTKGNLFLETMTMLAGGHLLLILFFGLFEGFLQAFVFSMLTLTYLSIALQGEGGH